MRQGHEPRCAIGPCESVHALLETAIVSRGTMLHSGFQNTHSQRDLAANHHTSSSHNSASLAVITHARSMHTPTRQPIASTDENPPA